MFSDNVGTFRGRDDDCNRLQVSRRELVSYLTNFDKRISDMERLSEENRELLAKNPLLNTFVKGYTSSLEKGKNITEQAKKIQSDVMNNQMNM